MDNGRILYWGESSGFAGGIERYAFQTALRLRENGWTVHWCGVRPDRAAELFRTGFDAVLSPREVLRQTANYDLAVLHKVPELSVLTELRRRFGERLVFWAHDHDLYCPRRHYYTPFGRINCHRAYEPLRCGLCARITSPRNWKYLKKNQSSILRELSQHHAAVLSGFMRDNLIRNGFRAEFVHAVPPAVDVPGSSEKHPVGPALRILFLGQLIRGKGVDLLLEALHRLTIPWEAVIAGDGNDRTMLEKTASVLGIADRVRFTGWLDEPESCFADCDAAVFPSRWQEPFGLSGAEASAHGLPVVAFDVGGVREWLEDSVTGFIVPEKDVGAMAARLEQLFRDRELAKRLGDAGRERIRERFSAGCFLAAMRQLLEQVNR